MRAISIYFPSLQQSYIINRITKMKAETKEYFYSDDSANTRRSQREIELQGGVDEDYEIIWKHCQNEVRIARMNIQKQIKKVMVFEPWDGIAPQPFFQPLSTKQNRSTSTNTLYSPIPNTIPQMNPEQIRTNQNVTKPQQIKEEQSQSTNQSYRNVAKTKFRQMRRRKRAVGPQPDSLRQQIEKIIELQKGRRQKMTGVKEESFEKEDFYASDQQSTASQQIIANTNKRRRSPLDCILSSLSSVIPQQEPVVYVPPGQVTMHNLEATFQTASLNICQAIYSAQPDEDPFYQTVFQHFRQELSYKASNERSSHHLSKGRLFMVRRAMEIYSGIEPKQHNELRYIRNRLTKKEKQAFTRSKLPSPPCRLTTGFLEELFRVVKFAQFFVKFVECGHLQNVLAERSQKQIANFRIFYKQIAAYDKKEERMRVLCLNPPPLSHLQIQLYMDEAKGLCDRYCSRQ